MTEQTPLWLEEKQQLAADQARKSTCPRCGAPVLTARAGHTAALDVRADPWPLTPVQEIRARLDGRLTWHLVASKLGPSRITWRHRFHITAGPAKHPVLQDHQCKAVAA